MPEPNIMINVPAGSGIDPMSSEELEAFRENAPECSRGALWSLLDWSLWGAGMADVFREPLANTMLAAVPNNVCRHAEAIMADFKQRRGITQAMRLAAAGDAAGAAAVLGDVAPDGGDLDG